MQEKLDELNKKANWLRLEVLKTAKKTGGKGSHLGGTFSCIELLVALYYGNILKFDPSNPKWVDRYRFLIGKGHVHLALFHIWVDLGFIDNSLLDSYGKNGSLLGQQLNNKIPGSEYNTGSLGHVIGVGSGMALAAKLDKKNYYTISLVGDAECDEGSIWESVMFAGRNQLNNLITIVDRNWMSVMDILKEDDSTGRLDEKFEACGWKSITINGHSFEDILSCFSDLEGLNKPLVIIADTIKGKGVSFMENDVSWHSGIPSNEEFDLAIRKLEEKN
jgi:transketolase|tara:strand:- start:818 stop:1645 length:828 start_codon:yes stop_codon:yes gene_type:complete